METLHKANTALVQENFKTAIALYTQTITNTPEVYEAHLHKGIAHMNLGEYTEAMKCATRAVELDDGNHLGYLYRGRIRFVSENWTQALEDFNRANELKAGSASNWLARCQQNLEDSKQSSN